MVFIGEAGGEDEDKQGLAFVGASGKEADKMLMEAGWARGDVWFTNPYKVRPPDNKIPRIGELGIDERVYLEEFLEELNDYKPTILMTTGVPTGILCPQTLSYKKNKDGRRACEIGKWRGSLLTSPLLNWPHYVIPHMHPAYVFREWSERQISVFIYARAKEEWDYFVRNGKLQELPARDLKINPTFNQAMDYISECIQGKTCIPGFVSVDIELLMGKKVKKGEKRNPHFVYTIALAKSPWDGMSIGLWDYTPEETVRLFRRLDDMLRSCTIIGQNYRAFDAHWLESIGFNACPSRFEDTRVRHHILWLEFEHSLQFQCMQYTREPYYKDEGKKWKGSKHGQDQLKRYNCKDACVTYEVYLEQEKEFDQRAKEKAATA